MKTLDLDNNNHRSYVGRAVAVRRVPGIRSGQWGKLIYRSLLAGMIASAVIAFMA